MVLPISVIQDLEKKLESYKSDTRFIELQTFLEYQKDVTLIKLQSTLDSNEVFKRLGEIRVYTKLLDLWKEK